MATEKIKEATEDVNVAEQRLMCQFDTMEQLYFEKEKLYLDQISKINKQNAETIENIEKRNAEEKESIRKHDHRIMLVQAITLFLIIASIIGAIVYVYANFDVEFQSGYSQTVTAEGGGDATNEDGIHVSTYDHPLE